MNQKEAVFAVIEALEALSVPYMVVGSLSSSAHGIPRSTKDADLVLELGDIPISRIIARLPEALKLDPQMSFETVTGTMRYKLYMRDDPFKIELFLLSNEAHDRERFRRRMKGDVMGRVVCLPTPEDVIITKLRWSKQGRRTKDVDDARNVIAVQGDGLDWDYIHAWCDRHGTRGLLEETRRSIPPI